MSRSDSRERYDEEQEVYYAKRRRIRDAGYEPNDLEHQKNDYRKAQTYLDNVEAKTEFYKAIVATHHRRKVRWEDFD